MNVKFKGFTKGDLVEPLAMLFGALAGIIVFWGSIIGYFSIAGLIFTIYIFRFVFFVKEKFLINDNELKIKTLFAVKTYVYDQYILFEMEKYNGRPYLVGIKRDSKKDYIFNTRLLDIEVEVLISELNFKLGLLETELISEYQANSIKKRETQISEKSKVRNEIIKSLFITLGLGFAPTIIIKYFEVQLKLHYNYSEYVNLLNIIYVPILLFAGVFFGVSFATTVKFVDDTGNKTEEDFVLIKKKYRLAGIALYIVSFIIIFISFLR